MKSKSIVSRAQTGTFQPSKMKTELIQCEVSYHLRVRRRAFQSGTLDDNCVFSSDETHFVVDINDGRALAMKGDDYVKFADVLNRDQGITMMVMLGGGSSARMEITFIIFQNKNSWYPMRGLPDEVPGVCYRTGPKG